jgi:hypothetical protein
MAALMAVLRAGLKAERAPLLLTRPTRAAGLARPRARVALAVIAVAVLLTLAALIMPLPLSPPNPAGVEPLPDREVHAAIIEGVRYQGGYYQVAADALRAAGRPLRPFVAVRLPTLTTLLALVPPFAAAVLQWLLGVAVLLAWFGRLAPVARGRAGRLLAVLLLIAGCAAAWQADQAPVHELWAGLLIALSLAVRRDDDWLPAVAFAVAAMAIRETAALYAMVMAAMALVERRRTEALGWGAALGIFALVLAGHAHAVALVTRPTDLAAAAASGLLGAGVFVHAIIDATALAQLPLWLAGPLTALGLLGLAAWGGALATRTLATILAYALLLSLFADADTIYWGMLVAPVSLVGLLFVPDLLRELTARAVDTRRITVRRVVR